MPAQRLTTRQRSSQLTRQKLMGRMKLGYLFALPEDKFRQLLSELENDSLFKELVQEWRIISYRKFPGVRATSSVQLDEGAIPSRESFDLEALLSKYPQTFPILKRIGSTIGEDRFSRLLYSGEVDIGSIAVECGLNQKEIRIFKAFLDEFELEKITSGFSESRIKGDVSVSAPRILPIASLERIGSELLIYPHQDASYLIKGRYSINYDRFEELYREAHLPQKKLDKISRVFKILDLINRRTTTIHQIIHHIKQIQNGYLYSGDERLLKPLTQKEMADRVGVHPSTINRMIADKSIITPQKVEKPLKFFFQRRKEIIKNYLGEIIEEERHPLKKGLLSRPLSDEAIRSRLCRSFGFDISRRAVAKYRKELRIPGSSKRKKTE